MGIGNGSSEWVLVTVGVLQGSAFGPVLFYITRLPTLVVSRIQLILDENLASNRLIQFKRLSPSRNGDAS